jgi:2-dehydro-3-deoxy-D-arabinonate dehydratase
VTYLTRHPTDHGPRWALDGQLLPAPVTLEGLLALPADALAALLPELPSEGAIDPSRPLLAPIEAGHEVWACGSTYLRPGDRVTVGVAELELITTVAAR